MFEDIGNIKICVVIKFVYWQNIYKKLPLFNGFKLLLPESNLFMLKFLMEFYLTGWEFIFQINFSIKKFTY